MAGNTVSVGLQVTAEGLDKVVDQSKQFKNNMQGGASALKAGEQASRGAAKAAYRQENQDYGISRGVSGRTGAGARDFAKESQGLGGLVHLYATFAANIFALTAAFQQLSKAADTKNMEEGMSQLSASSGKTLKTLAGQMRDVSDGALSMRDSLNATALATAGGMSSSQILKMTELARKASAALGRDMSDSMDRITKGIIKVQPELLDELGIMTRVIPAQQAYALSLGRSVASLTDFEKKQAFANAVLKEAEQKFGSINVDANPYSKLSASLADLASSTLMFVNKALGPLAKFLSESPAALAAVVGTFASMLVSRAIPVLSQWRGSLKDTADEMAKTAKKIKEDMPDKWFQNLSSKLELPRVADQLNNANKAAEKLSNTIKGKLAATSVGTALKMTEKDLESNPNILKNLNSLTANREKALAEHLAGTKVLTDAKVEQHKIELAQIATARDKVLALKEYKAVYDKIEHESNKKPGFFSAEAIAERRYTRAQNTAAVYGIRSNAAENATTYGLRESLSKMNKEISDKGLTGFTKFNATVTGGLSAITSKISGVVSSLGVWGAAVGALMAVYGIMDGWLSKNTAQLEKFNTAMNQTSEAAKVFDDVIKGINKKAVRDPLEAFSVKSLEAISNAMLGVADSVANLSKTFDEARSARSWWDSTKDTFAYMFGQSDAQQGSKKLAAALASMIKNMPKGPARDAYLAQLKGIFKFEGTDTKGLYKGLSALSEEGFSEAAGKLAELQKTTAQVQASQTANASAAVSSMDKLNSSYQTLKGSLADTSPTTQFAVSMITAAADVSKAFENTTNSISVIQDLLKNPEHLQFLPLNTQKELKDASVSLTKLTDQQHTLNTAVSDYDDLISKKLDKKSGLETDKRNNKNAIEFIDKDIAALEKGRDEAKRASAEISKKLDDITNRFANVFGDTMKDGVNLITFSFEQSAKRAALELAGVNASKLQGPGASAIQTNIKNAEIELQKQQVTTMFLLIKAIEDNTLQTEISNVEQKLKSIKESGDIDSKDLKTLETLQKTLKELEARKTFRDTAANSKSSADNIKEEFAGLSDASKKAESTYLVQVLGMRQKLGDLAAKQAVNNLEQFYKEREELKASEDRKTQAQISEKKFASERLAQLASYATVYDTQAKEEARASAEDLAILQQKAELQKAEFDRETQLIALKKLGKLADPVNAKKLIDEADGKVNDLKTKQATETSNRNIAAEISRIKEKYALEKRLAEDSMAWQILNRKNEDASLNNTRELLTYFENIGAVTKEFAIEEQKSLDIKLAQLQTLREIEDINKSISDKERASKEQRDSRIAALGARDQFKGGASEYDKEVSSITASSLKDLADEKSRAEFAKNSLTTQLELKTKLIVLESDQKREVERLNAVMQLTQSGATSLVSVFGEVGSAISDSANKMVEFSNTVQLNATAELVAKQKLIDAENARIAAVEAFNMADSFDRTAANANKLKALKTEEDAKENLGKLTTKNKMSELQGAADIAKAVGGMFAKNSAAAKAFAAVEKAIHIVRLAMWVKEMIGEVQKTAGAVAGAGIRSEAAIAEGGVLATLGVINQAQGDPYSAFGRMAAMGAIMAGLLTVLGSSGSGPSINTTGITASDRQSTQGTGMSWALDANGEMTKQENGGGVFGDTSMKSDSINKSLEIIKATSVEGISYDTKMVDLLTQINLGINKLATTLYAVQGVRTGTGFGTVEGTSGGGGGLLSGLFGSSKTETSIIDSGIKLKGTFMDLVNAGKNANAVLQQFETVQTTTTSSGAFFGLFGGGSSSSVRDNIKELDSAVREQIGGVFSNARDIFVEQGKKLSMDVKSIDSILSSVNVDKLASLRGLKGDELDKELNSVISSIMDDAAKELFPKLDQFKRFNEGYAQTVTRVLDTNSKINDSFKAMGKTMVVLAEVPSKATEAMLDAVKQAEAELAAAKAKVAEFKPTYSENPIGYGAPVASTIDPKLTDAVTESEKQLAEARETVKKANEGMTANNLALTESLADAAGGLDKFLELTKTFTDKYLSEVERAGPKVDALRTEMASLGLSSTTTRTQLKTLISTYEVTDAKTAQYYVDLLKLADAYDAAGSEIDKIAGKLGMSTSGIQSILSDAVKNANSEEEARKLGTQGFADALNSALQSSLISGISSIIYSSVIEPMIASLTTGATAASLDIATGGAVAGSNMATGSAVAASDMATGSAVAGSNMAAGSAVAGSNMAAGSAAAGSNMASGGAAAAQNLTSGSQVAAANIAGAIGKVKEFVTTFVGVMKDPEVQSALKELSSSFGDFAAMAYTGSSAINTLTTSIGGTSKAATGSSGSGGASSAADDLTKAWQSAADAIFEEVKRIKGIMLGTGAAALENAKSKFESATLAARAGDIEQAKLLPQLSQTLLTLAESNASSALDLRKIQAATAASLETTGLGAVSQYGLKLPSYDIGTNYVPKDMIAQIHEGEQIVPKAYNPSLNNQSNDALVQEIKILQQQVASLVAYNRTISDNTQKTRDVLVRVTEDGRAIQTEVAA